MTYARDRSGFFEFPSDREGNNLRDFVMTAAAARDETGPAAERLARESLAEAG
jgi:hypothetical protein